MIWSYVFLTIVIGYPFYIVPVCSWLSKEKK